MSRKCIDCKWQDGQDCYYVFQRVNKVTGFVEGKFFDTCKVNRMFRFPGEVACGLRGRWFEPKQKDQAPTEHEQMVAKVNELMQSIDRDLRLVLYGKDLYLEGLYFWSSVKVHGNMTMLDARNSFVYLSEVFVQVVEEVNKAMGKAPDPAVMKQAMEDFKAGRSRTAKEILDEIRTKKGESQC